MGFLFDTKKGETPETLKRQREIIRALMGAQRAPQNVGEGLSALGDGIVANVLGGRADRAEQAGMESAASAMGPLPMMFGGGAEAAGGTVAPSGSNYSALADGPKGQEAYAGFEAKAPQIISRLASDLGITPEAAAGVVGQLGHESEGLQAINERNPTVPGSRGGFGWAQWTGPRRKQFEQWSGQQGLDPTSDDANYGFLMHELKNTPEGGVLGDLKGVGDAQTAGRIFTDKFLRPGIPGYGSRSKWTDRALSAYQGAGPQPAVAANEAMANGQPVQVASLDPSSGVVQALAEQGIDPNGPQAQAFASLQQGSGQPSGPAQGLPPDSPIIRALMGQSGGDPTNPGGQFPAAPPQAVPQQLAQAGGQFPAAPPDPGSGEGRIRQLLATAQQPFLNETQQGVVKALLGEEMQKRDPAYKMGLEKSQLELEALRNPKASEAEKLAREKFDYDRNKDQLTAEDWEKLDDDTLYRPATGETKELRAGGEAAGFRFQGNSVEAQALNGLMDSKQLTAEQAQQVAAGKTITGPNGEMLFLTPQGIFQQDAQGGPATPITPPVAGGATPAGPATLPSPTGIKTLTGPKEPTVDEKKAMTFADRMSNSGAIIDEMGMRGSGKQDRLLSGVPMVSEYLTSTEFKKVDQAKRDFINAQLRRESGAVISPEEFANAEQQYFPQPNDGPELLEQKRKNRQIVIDGMKRDGGPTYKPATDGNSETTINPGDTRTYGGVTYKFNGGDPADPQSWTK